MNPATTISGPGAARGREGTRQGRGDVAVGGTERGSAGGPSNRRLSNATRGVLLAPWGPGDPHAPDPDRGGPGTEFSAFSGSVAPDPPVPGEAVGDLPTVSCLDCPHFRAENGSGAWDTVLGRLRSEDWTAPRPRLGLQPLRTQAQTPSSAAPAHWTARGGASPDPTSLPVTARARARVSMLSAGHRAPVLLRLRRLRRRLGIAPCPFLRGLGPEPFGGARSRCSDCAQGDARDEQRAHEAARERAPGAEPPPSLPPSGRGLGDRCLSSLESLGLPTPPEEPSLPEREVSSGARAQSDPAHRAPGDPTLPALGGELHGSYPGSPSREEPFRAGELILAETERREKQFKKLFRLSSAGRLSSSWGVVAFSDILGKLPGQMLRSSLGQRFLLRRPALEDYVLLMERGPAITYPKVTPWELGAYRFQKEQKRSALQT